MAGPNAQTGGADAAPPAPPLDPESADWAALAKELDSPDDLLGEGEPPAPQQDEPPARKEGDAEPPPRPSYEQLETGYRNTTKALREARAQEKEARETLGNITRMVEGLRQARQQPEPEPQAPPPKAPTVEEDPIGYFQHELAKRDHLIQQLQQGTQQSVQQVAQQTENMRFIQEVERSEVAMRASAPDYDQACEHLERGRIAELEIMLPDDSPQAVALARQAGLQSPEQLRMVMLNNDRIAVARQAMQLGRSPAEVYYTLAKSRGYAPKAGAAPRSLNGGVRQAAPTQAEQAIEAARRGQKAARSLGGSSGSSDNALNANDLLDLYEEDPEAFDKQWDAMARSGKLG